MKARITLLGLVVALVAQPTAAQTGWEGRTRVGLNVGAQAETQRLSETIALEQYLESAPAEARLPAQSVRSIEGYVAVALVGRFGVWFALSYVSDEGAAAVSAEIPHPFYFNQRRRISGSASVELSELVTHLDLVYFVTARRLELALAVGPSFFGVDRDLVTDVEFTEAYPFDTADFSRATVGRARESTVGYNVAADLTWKLSRRWGVGGLIRFARAQVTLSTPNGLGIDETAIGGLQAGGGLRVAF